jgi:hypothetical protein
VVNLKEWAFEETGYSVGGKIFERKRTLIKCGYEKRKDIICVYVVILCISSDPLGNCDRNQTPSPGRRGQHEIAAFCAGVIRDMVGREEEEEDVEPTKFPSLLTVTKITTKFTSLLEAMGDCEVVINCI